MEKLLNIIEDPSFDKYYQNLGITDERANEMMEGLKNIVLKRIDTRRDVAHDWLEMLDICRDHQEVAFCMFKLGEANGLGMMHSEGGPIEMLLKALAEGLSDKFPGLKVDVRRGKQDDLDDLLDKLRGVKDNPDDDVDIRGSEHH